MYGTSPRTLAVTRFVSFFCLISGFATDHRFYTNITLQFLIGGVVVPLLATVGINNKVSFLEKSGTSEFANSTGAYELDLTLVDDFSLAWREMHVKTDVFCSGSLVLPDKAGRIINVGGWSHPSTTGIRFYSPDGSAGVNGTNDWEENSDILALQVSHNRDQIYNTLIFLYRPIAGTLVRS